LLLVFLRLRPRCPYPLSAFVARHAVLREIEEFGVPLDQLVPEALKIAARIATLSPVAVAVSKASVNRAFETTLAEGVRYERAVFLSLFGTPHQREGMAAFVEKRPADFGLG